MNPESDWRSIITPKARKDQLSIDITFTLTKHEIQYFLQECLTRMEARPLNSSEKHTLQIEVIGFKKLILRVWEHSGLSGKTLIMRRTFYSWSGRKVTNIHKEAI
jgi:hypothetical protein